MFKHILLPTDGSELAATAVKRGVALAKEIGAKVTFLMVIEPLSVLTANPAGLREALDALTAEADKTARATLLACEAEAEAAGVEAQSMTSHHEHPAAQIVAAAEGQGCDLIALSSHGRSGLSKLILGSQTQRVVATAHAPVLVFR